MKFDKSKILTCVTADQLEEGQLGWIENDVDCLKSTIQHITPYKVFSTNKNIVDFPFKAEDRGIRRYFYPAPEPTYAERQAEWVKQNNVRFGTKVRFTKNFTNGEDGSGCCENKCVKGMEGVVKYAEDDYLYVLVPYFGCLAVPFTALEVIKKPTYRPYNNDELNDLVGEVLTNKKSGRRKLVTGKSMEGLGVNLDGSYISAKDLLSSFYRNTNEPCGIKEEV